MRITARLWLLVLASAAPALILAWSSLAESAAAEPTARERAAIEQATGLRVALERLARNQLSDAAGSAEPGARRRASEQASRALAASREVKQLERAIADRIELGERRRVLALLVAALAAL